MRKLLATVLAVFTFAGSIVSASVAPAEARNRDLFFYKRGGFVAGPNRGARFYGYNGGYRGYRHYGGGPGYYGYGGPRYYGYGSRRNYGYGGPRYYGYGSGYYGYDDGFDGGAAIAGGIIGLAAGALLSGALNHPHSYGGSCSARFRSYDPASGTYLGRDGRRHACR